jgi:hypothetical protein
VKTLAPLLTLVFFCIFQAPARAGVINNSSLSVTIRDDNGAIGQVTFGAADFFNPGTAISNFGLEGDPLLNTFVLNDTSGRSDQFVSHLGLNTYAGTYTKNGALVDFQRSYSLVAGLNVLRITTSFTNRSSDLTLSYFDTFDPDQGFDLVGNFKTYNDVFGLAGGRVGQARIDIGGFTHTVIIGSLDARAVVASGDPLQIFDSVDLNGFLASPFDGNDSLADEGTHVGFRSLIKSGASTTFTVDLAFGLTPTDAQNAFMLANVPEPGSFAAFAVLGLVVAGMRMPRRR